MKHLFICGLWATFLAFPVLILAQENIQPAVARQIKSLIEEKESRTANQKKMGSQLWYALKMERKQSITPLVPTLEVETVRDVEGLVAVDIKSKSTSINPILDFVKKVNGRIQSSHPRFRSVLAYIPILEAENLVGLQDVHFAEIWVKPQNNSNRLSLEGRNARTGQKSQSRPSVNGAGTIPSILAGATVSEADETHLASSVRAIYNVNGSGVKIGILSDSYNSLGAAATDVTQGELPGIGNPAGFTTPVTVLSEFAGGTDEGRAMIQLVHDLAPGAQLYYASAFNGEADFAQQILNLRAAGCDVIVDDVSYLNEPVFQDGVIARAVSSVTASGASYFSSAGNSGNKSDNTSGVWEGDFKDGGTHPELAGGSLHDFATGVPNNALTVAGRPYLKWSDPLGLSGNDYDLFSLNSAGTAVLAASSNFQDGDDDPIEFLASQAIGRRLVIFKKTAAAIRALHLNTNRGRLTVGTSGVTFGHNAGKSTICVGATPALAVFPNPHNNSNATETFSSDGPRRIFYKPDTTAITPGNVLFSTLGGEKLQKPDFTAADGTNTTVTGFKPFFGTSAAAPHAAAIAALLKSKIPSLTNTQIYNALIVSALDIEAPGVDENSGAGIIMANTAMIASGATPLFADVAKIAHAAEEGGFNNGNGGVDPGEVAHLKIRLRNRSTLAAQNVVAILFSNQPGVQIFGNKWELNTLAGLTDSSNNLLPFQVGIPSSLVCGSTLALTLKLVYVGSSSDTTEIPVSVTIGSQPYLSIASALGQAPASAINVVTTSGTINSRISRNQIIGTCNAPKSNPGAISTSGSVNYHAYKFTNTSTVSQCVSVTQSSSVAFSNLYSMVYNNSGFLPGSVATNFVADFGNSTNNGTYSFTVNAGEQFTAVVNEITPDLGIGIPYNLKVSLANCSPAPTCTSIEAASTSYCGLAGQPIDFQPQITGGSGLFASSGVGSLPAGLNFTNGGFTGSISATGVFTVRILFTDLMNCPPSEIDFTFRISDQIQATASDDSLCSGESTILQGAPAASSDMIYNWSDGVQNGVAFVPTSTKVYLLTSSFGPCVQTDSVRVVVNPVPSKPVIQALGAVTFCEGGSVVLNSGASSGSRWSNGSTSQEITVNQAGEFTVQIVAAGCSSAVSDRVVVDVKPRPTVNAGADQAINLGQSATLTATGADFFQWSPLTGLNPANGVGASVVASPASTTLYTVTGTSSNGCQNTDDVQITVNSILIPLTPPVISPGTGAYTGPLTVTITGVAGSSLYYTTNGNNPRVDVPNGFTRLYTGPFQVSSNTTIRAIAVRGSEVTSVRVAFLTVTNPAVCDPPFISPGTGIYSTIQKVSMSTATAGAEIWYTTNGNLPLFSTPNSFTRKYTGPIQVDRTTTINAVAIKTGVQNSSNTRVVLTINLAQSIGSVVFSPAPGIYSVPTSVSMSCNVPEAQIFYSTNGNTPRIDVFNYFTRLYSVPLVVSVSTNFKAMGVKAGLINGPVTNGVYTFIAPSRMATDEPELGLYPNPARDRIYVNLLAGEEGEALLDVYDLRGRRMLSQSISSNGSHQEIDVQNLPAGCYLVKVRTESRQIIRQFVKE